MRPHPLAVALFTALAFLLPTAHAQTAPPASATASADTIPRLQGEITIDGVLDEAVWQQAKQVQIGYEVQPGDNIPAPVKTTVRVGYTTDALYVAFHAVDPHPEAIRATLRDRDSAFNDDWVGIFMDTFNDHRRAYELVVNPFGVQADLIRDETSTNNQEDASWDGLWSSAGKLTAVGYDVEMRIPFSTLRFPNSAADPQRWGIVFIRNYPRDKRHQLMSVRVPRDSNCFQCEWGKYDGMAGVQQGRNIEVVPTLAMGASQSRARAGTAWSGRETYIEPGVDVSWAPTPNMTLNATLNPDFSQVESDQLQLNVNDSFALFFPEKRPFFLEGADYFNTQYQVLYTRQVADPDFGARITGRTDSGAYGAFVARDATTQLLVPGVLGSGFRFLDQKANIAVGRYRHDLNANTSIGVIGTSRHGEDYGNDVAGVDGRWQKGAHTLTAQWLHSQSEYPTRIVDAYKGDLGNDPTPSGNAWRAYYGFSNTSWDVNTTHQQVDPGFRADLGFIGQVGYRKSVLGAGHSWYPKGFAFNRIRVYSDWDITHRFDGQLLERELEASINFNDGPRQSWFGISPLTRVRYWEGRMFKEHNLNLSGNGFVVPAIKLGTYMNFGQQLDLRAARTGRRRMVGLWTDADLGRSVNLNVDISRQQLQRDGGTAFEASLVNATGSWQIDPRQRLRLTVQGSEVLRDARLYDVPVLPQKKRVNETARDWAAQLVYSYKVNPRTALYAGGSYGAFMDDDHRDLFGNTRSLFVKLSYGWQP